MDTDSLYLALAQEELEDCRRTEMKTEWERVPSQDCSDCFIADSIGEVFSQCAVTSTKKRQTRTRDFQRRVHLYMDAVSL